MAHADGRHKTCDKSLQPTIAWLKDQPGVTKVIFGHFVPFLHKHEPGKLQLNQCGKQFRGYANGGYQVIHVKCATVMQHQALVDRVHERWPPKERAKPKPIPVKGPTQLYTVIGLYLDNLQPWAGWFDAPNAAHAAHQALQTCELPDDLVIVEVLRGQQTCILGNDMVVRLNEDGSVTDGFT